MGSILAGLVGVGLLWLLGLPLLLAWLGGWSVPAFALYGLDKQRARAGDWRIPEAFLHALALVGGVLGAWAGRAVFHHKTRQPSFLVVLVVASVLWAGVALVAILR